uniref:Uncharacterized protein n=1 Tax=Rhizophagus irregularis (strain DAOM 181602 / DAOM 197198 / MUCL 43194) TaxID=747089 RepID=U9UX11_RHIID
MAIFNKQVIFKTISRRIPKGQIATQPENFNNADLRKLSLKMANTPFLPDCHIIM